ncbi:MAG: hypothetical protein ABGY41_15100 [Candidatus Poribacteria bacterium]
MAQAYTPGLAVSRGTTIRKERKLPLPGEVLVALGDQVEADTVVATTDLPGAVHLINLASALSVPESDVEHHLTVEKGRSVGADEVIAETKGLFGFFKSQCRAPVAGVLESVSTVTGQAILREPPTPLQVRAYARGVVVEVLEGEGVVVEAHGAYVQGIIGLGGEAVGEIASVEGGPADPLTAASLTEEHRGKVVIGGGRIETAAVRAAQELGVTALVVGGIDDADLRELLGYELGVAITGTENLGVTLVITEGFGDVAMAARTFDLLTSHVGALASVNGATQIRAGVLRPEIVIPHEGADEEGSADGPMILEPGAAVRVIREPHFGRVGRVVAMVVELTVIETEARVRTAEVEFEDGSRALVPRANIELMAG